MRHTTATHTLTIRAGATLRQISQSGALGRIGGGGAFITRQDFPNLSAIQRPDGSFRVVLLGRTYEVSAGDVEDVRVIDD